MGLPIRHRQRGIASKNVKNLAKGCGDGDWDRSGNNYAAHGYRERSYCLPWKKQRSPSFLGERTKPVSVPGKSLPKPKIEISHSVACRNFPACQVSPNMCQTLQSSAFVARSHKPRDSARFPQVLQITAGDPRETHASRQTQSFQAW